MKRSFLFIASALLVAGGVNAQSNPESISIQNSLNELSGLQSSHVASMISFSRKEDTKGSRYLFSHWAKGTVVGNNDVIIRNDSLLFNYDKITQSLYMTADMKTMMEIDKGHIKAFTLRNENGDPSSFMKITAISADDFLQVVAGGEGKYAAYKLSKTKFIKSNYRTDGLVETGNNYDEYLDENEYYIQMPGPVYKLIELKKKSIKGTLSAEPGKVNEYLSDHKYDSINEDFIKGLTNYLNK